MHIQVKECSPSQIKVPCVHGSLFVDVVRCTQEILHNIDTLSFQRVPVQ